MPIHGLPVALTAEGAAAIYGALAGGAIVIVSQLAGVLFTSWRARRVAATLIYAELTTNYANASAAVNHLGWPSSRPEADRAAYDAHGARLLRPWHRPHDLGAIAGAYSRVDDIAWLESQDGIEPADDYSEYLLDIQLGVYVAGLAAGYDREDLRLRTLPVDELDARLHEQLARSKRPRWPLRALNRPKH